MTGDSFRSKDSSVSQKSKKSVRSHVSADSQRSTASNKIRLNMVREKQK